jgi:sulfur carrier protein ThiS
MVFNPNNQTETNNSTILVNVVQLGSSPIAVEIAEGATVGEVLDKAGVNAEAVSVRGERYGREAVVEDGDRLTITQSVKGGRS